MKYTKVKTDTFQTLQLNAGILVTGLDAANKLLGAFSEGAYNLITGIEWKNIGSSVSGFSHPPVSGLYVRIALSPNFSSPKA